MKTKIHLICAARPNFMKIAPLYRAFCKEDAYQVKLIHTGQHYDHNMSDIFFQQLGLPEPDYHLNIGSGTHAQQTGNTMIAYENLCLNVDRPDLAIVVGDVNATIACTLSANKIGIPVAHLEAGLRSFDRKMPEEINRLLTDAICDILWTPSLDANQHLSSENVAEEKISFVGNIMIDSLVMMMPQIDQSNILNELELKPGNFSVVTLHRPSNVDNSYNLEQILNALKMIENQIIMPLHPRTKKAIEIISQDKIPENIHFTNPMSYIDFMSLVKNASFVLTDSGGLQEETTYLNIPCFTMRANTERPITIEQGTNILVTPDNLRNYLSQKKQGKTPQFWDGNTASRIIEDLKKRGFTQNAKNNIYSSQ